MCQHSGMLYGWSQRYSVNLLSMLNLRRRNNLWLTCSLRCKSSVKSSVPGSSTLLYTSNTFYSETNCRQIFYGWRSSMWLLCGRDVHNFKSRITIICTWQKFSPFYMWLAAEQALIVVQSWSIVALSYWNIAGVVRQFSTVVSQPWSRQSTPSYDPWRLFTINHGCSHDCSTTPVRLTKIVNRPRLFWHVQNNRGPITIY